MARFVEDRSTDTLFVDGSLDSLLPANAMGRVVQAALAGLDFVAFDDRYANDAMGRPAVEARPAGGGMECGLVACLLVVGGGHAVVRRGYRLSLVAGGCAGTQEHVVRFSQAPC